ncbi:MAG TPA: Xaa-Pro peptidase family protein [Bryobacteraceae bacterium]|nr:Xaa-Pro peptidase family protein [Bryobacteraceae bacterium]
MTDYKIRRRNVARELPQHKADVLLVSGLPNVRYLSGFTGSNAVLLLTAEHAVLLTDPRYTIQAQEECDCNVRIERGSLYEAASKWIARKKLKRVAVEQSRLTLAAYSQLRDSLKLGATLRPTAGLVEKHRMVKSAAEVDAIRTSVNTNSRAFAEAVKTIRDGMSETDLAAEIEYRMRRNGAERPSFETIVAAGARTALPHAQPTTAKLHTLLLIDMGCMQAGYASDMTRMLHLGKPGARVRKLYKAVLEAQLASIAAVRAGVKAGDVDRAARKVLKAHGFEKEFVHSTGHGLGLEIHEPPRLGKRDGTYLQAGMVITIEPGAYIQDTGGVRIEDTVLVTESGCEILTPTPKELVVV